MNIEHISLCAILLPLLSATIVGCLSQSLSKTKAHTITIAGVSLSFLLSIWIAYFVFFKHITPVDVNLYTWASGGCYFPYAFHIGLLIDPLTTLMLLVVNIISLLVHIYSIGYMADDQGYVRFFSYISLFTFMMLMLITANNFLQLFFGWEGVGLVSYLLIGFWYHKESALQGSLKAFIVNRVGDFGFILGISLILIYAGSLNYATVFQQAPILQQTMLQGFSGQPWSVITIISLLLFVGAMGKSAQMPLHVWLPESMEGPTPISALIHAATMVTAGVFMIARLSPLIEYSDVALSVILVVGATTALLTGLIAIVMHDIKRVIAYSTLSQLGYMMAALGASAYSAGLFHLTTHAFFKALLFLAAGSVILAMHHEQDMRKMGQLYKKCPITYGTFLIGALALCALPPFSGFYSKDLIIDMIKLSQLPGHTYAYICVVLGAMITALYTFRALFMTFHGKQTIDPQTYAHLHESPPVVTIPLILLAIPSAIIGWYLFVPMLYDKPDLLAASILVLPTHQTHHLTTFNPISFMFAAFKTDAFWLTLLGIGMAWINYQIYPHLPSLFSQRFHRLYTILCNKYGLDSFNDWFWVRGCKKIGYIFYHTGDQRCIDGMVVNGSAYLVQHIAERWRTLQSGYLFHYTTIMVMGVIGFLAWFLMVRG